MADRNHPNTADQVDLSENDPFAELTRIMGFDPRHPARPAAEASADDFSIDLEKEMMGEFDAEDERAAVAPSVSVVAPEPHVDDAAADDADFGEIELDFAEDFDDTLAAAVQDEPVAPQSAAVGDLDIDLELEDAFADAVEDERAALAETAAQDVEEIEVELDFAPGFDDELAASAAMETAGEAAGMRSDEGDASETPDMVAAASEPALDDDIAAGFDAALLESDLDYHAETAAAEEAADEPQAGEPLVSQSADFEEPAEEAPLFEDDALDFGEDDLDLQDDETAAFAESSAPQADEAMVSETAELTEQAEDAPVFEDDELLFSEDDFSLQGDEAAANGYEAAADDQAVEYSEPAEAELDDPLETALPMFPSRPMEQQSAEAVEPEPEPVEEESWEAAETDLEDELNALLGNIAPASGAMASEPVESRVETPAAPVDHQAADTHADADLDWDLDEEDFLAADEVGEQAAAEVPLETASYVDDQNEEQEIGFDPVDELDFDHDALDQAIANGLAAGGAHDLPHEPHAPEAAPAARQAGPREDPLDVIAALTAKYSAPLSAVAYGRTNAAPIEDAPDVETIEVQDKAVALADDLDIPELAHDEAPVVNYDDLETEFAGLIGDMQGSEAAPRQIPGDDAEHEVWRSEVADHGYEPADETAGYAPAPTHAAYDDEPGGEYDYDEASRQTDAGGPEADEDYDYDPDFDEAVAAPGMTGERSSPQRRSMLIAAIVGGVAILGGVGAFALSFGGSGDDVPVLVRADDGPIKVKPENPGGTTVPNQDSKVYETVAGMGKVDAPQQERLVTTAEEPVDMTPPAPEPEPDLAELAAAEDPNGLARESDPVITRKGEDRIEQILQDAETDLDTQVAAIAPRKVRTMIVKPDGTLVEREDPTPAEPIEPQAAATEALAEPAAAPPASHAAAGAPDFTPPPAGETAAAAPVQATEAAPAVPAMQATMPDSVPIAPSRPSAQPVDVVGEVKPDQVAAANPSASNAAGAWSMQIASQPSEAAAQSTYQDLARRYGGVLNGRQANIVKADIAGRGTFWRVRVPAQSRNEAISLCESYKAAGGNCFVSR